MKLAALKQHSLLYPHDPATLRRFAKGFNVNINDNSNTQKPPNYEVLR